MLTLLSELATFFYGLINLALLLLALFLRRRPYAVFGEFGVAAYVHHLAYEVFRDSRLYPFALSLIGIRVIAAGLLLHRHRVKLERLLTGRLPPALQAIRPAQARCGSGVRGCSALAFGGRGEGRHAAERSGTTDARW